MESCEAFQRYVLQEARGEILPDGRMKAFGRTVRVNAFPIGIDPKAFAELTESPEGQASFTRMVESKARRKMIVGVDRLDYSKGLEDRLLAYERLLSERPDLRREVFLLQISTPTREDVPEYRKIAQRLDALTGRINGAHADMDWVPIRNVHRFHSRAELAGIFRAAEVGLVTPLRDGMNLVAKEYVAAQDQTNPGVLVLSRFAGAAAQMQDALIVNPFSQEDVADAVCRALSMSLEERRSRWRALMHGLLEHDIYTWRDDFVHALERARHARSRLIPALSAIRASA